MKTKIANLLLCLLFLTGIFGMVGCIDYVPSSEDEGTETNATIMAVYEQASALGYEGSLEDFLALVQGKDGENGTDGRGIEKTEIENGELIIYYTDGTNVNLGNVVGADGKDGVDGTNGKDGEDGKDGVDGAPGKDGQDGKDGVDGAPGKDGVDGEDGRGIEKTEIVNGELIIYYTDGTNVNLGKVVGEDGKDGENGKDGEDGEDGVDGAPGQDGTNGTNGAQGEKGEDGADGKDGQDGVGIENITVNVNGQLVITLTNGNTFTFDISTEDGTFVPTHNFGEWQTLSGENLPCEQRVFFTTCSTCGEMKFKHGTANDHNFATTYSFDGSYHWLKCQNCTTIVGKAEHTADENGECSVCTAPLLSTEGIIYEVSADGTYAEVVAYEGTATKVKIADTYEGVPVKSIYKHAFYDNDTITSIIIPDSVEIIADYAFSECDNLVNVTIPDSVTTIGKNAFYCCGNLTSIIIGNSVTSIGERAFMSTNLTSITIPDSVSFIGNEALLQNELIEISVSENNKNYKDIDGVLYTKDGKTLIQYPRCKNEISFSIPNSVEIISDYAFYNCYYLTEIVIPNGVTSIGRLSFFGCKLIEITIPDSVISIGHAAFITCSDLTSVVIGNGVTTIGSQAFDSCSNLTNVVIGNSVSIIPSSMFSGCNHLTKVAIPDNVTTISSYAFEDCTSLTEVIIPDSVKYIEAKAFENCYRIKNVVIGSGVIYIYSSAFTGCDRLSNIYYKGNEEEWSTIVRDLENSILTNTTVYYYSESEPTTDGNYWHYVNGVPTAWVKEN